MTNDKVEVSIKVTVDSEDIEKLIKKEISFEKQDNETLKRDKLLLELMTHVYDEDERRNELVDSKNSQMIVFETHVF